MQKNNKPWWDGLSREEMIRLSQENDEQIFGAYRRRYIPDEIEIKSIDADGNMEVELTFSNEAKANEYLRRL